MAEKMVEQKWSVGDVIVHPMRGPGVVKWVQMGRIRVVWGGDWAESWVSTRTRC